MLSRTVHYASRNIEYILIIFIMAGIISMNKSFAYIGIHQVYITEFLLLITLLSLFAKLMVTSSIDFHVSSNWINFYLKYLWPLILLLVYGIARLGLDLNYGMQAIRHGMILFYTIAFVSLFTLAIKNERHLSFIITYLLIIFSSLFNGIKILVYKYLHITFNYYEQERVFHIETDTICASIALIGLLVYHKQFLKKSKIGFALLILLNVVLLFLTVKRSAVLGMIPSFLMYLYFIREKLELKNVIKAMLAILILSILFLGAIYLFSPETISHYWGYFISKISLKETNTNWRLLAWSAAFDKFSGHEWWGIGYGPNLLDVPINNVDTNDPHNSFLAFLVRHGILISGLYLLFIARTYMYIFEEVKTSEKGSQNYYNSIFIGMGLTSMIIFAFFNVVMENQYEGIFFNFFLAGIYIVKAGKMKTIQNFNFPNFNALGYSIIVILILFLSFAFSPFNDAGKIMIYSSATNSEMPLLNNSYQKSVRLVSKMKEGISLTADSASKITYTELSWFFPVHAYKQDLSKYNLEIVSAGDKKHISYAVQYEDNTRIPLKGNTQQQNTLLPLAPLEGKKNGIKIKYVILSFNDVSSANDIVIKYIYLNKK